MLTNRSIRRLFGEFELLVGNLVMELRKTNLNFLL